MAAVRNPTGSPAAILEDHRNLLILAPVHVLSVEAMATLPAALKRGIGMTFQIEASGLVAEPRALKNRHETLIDDCCPSCFFD